MYVYLHYFSSHFAVSGAVLGDIVVLVEETRRKSMMEGEKEAEKEKKEKNRKM